MHETFGFIFLLRGSVLYPQIPVICHDKEVFVLKKKKSGNWAKTKSILQQTDKMFSSHWLERSMCWRTGSILLAGEKQQNWRSNVSLRNVDRYHHPPCIRWRRLYGNVVSPVISHISKCSPFTCTHGHINTNSHIVKWHNNVCATVFSCSVQVLWKELRHLQVSTEGGRLSIWRPPPTAARADQTVLWRCECLAVKRWTKCRCYTLQSWQGIFIWHPPLLFPSPLRTKQLWSPLPSLLAPTVRQT